MSALPPADGTLSHQGSAEGEKRLWSAVSRIAIAILLLIAPACAAALPQAESPGAEPRMSLIRVEGNRLVDEAGETVVLRGVSFSDPDWLEPRGQWNREYFAAARSWNANLVRIPVHPGRWRDRGEESFLSLLDQGVQWAGELGMYVIIDWHSIGNLHTERFTRDVYETTQAETLRFWETIAERYAGNPVVAFYELFNEPTVDGGRLGPMSWEEHKQLMEELIAVIFARDPAAIPLVTGFNWGYDLTPVRHSPVAFPGVAYVSHPYPQKREPPWEEKWEQDWGFVADTYPMVATEFGFMSSDGPGAPHVPVIGDETYGEAIIDYFERKGISWTAWVFDPIWSPQLIANWDFEPTRQGAFFREKMMLLNPRD
jgi:endoglucanase